MKIIFHRFEEFLEEFTTVDSHAYPDEPVRVTGVCETRPLKCGAGEKEFAVGDFSIFVLVTALRKLDGELVVVQCKERVGNVMVFDDDANKELFDKATAREKEIKKALNEVCMVLSGAYEK